MTQNDPAERPLEDGGKAAERRKRRNEYMRMWRKRKSTNIKEEPLEINEDKLGSECKKTSIQEGLSAASQPLNEDVDADVGKIRNLQNSREYMRMRRKLKKADKCNTAVSFFSDKQTSNVEVNQIFIKQEEQSISNDIEIHDDIYDRKPDMSFDVKFNEHNFSVQSNLEIIEEKQFLEEGSGDVDASFFNLREQDPLAVDAPIPGIIAGEENQPEEDPLLNKSGHSGERPLRCDMCGKSFNNKSTLRMHLRIHTREIPYKCNECGETFSLLKKLKLHSKKFHSVDDKSQESSGADPLPKNKNFDIENDENCTVLNNESRVPDKKMQMAFECKEFGNTISRKFKSKHLRFHVGEKRFMCKECGKEFSRLVNLTNHLRTHSGEKTFMCDVCGKSFTHGSSLTIHLRTHTGEKPYKCNECGKAFNQKWSLKHHFKKNHSGEKSAPNDGEQNDEGNRSPDFNRKFTSEHADDDKIQQPSRVDFLPNNKNLGTGSTCSLNVNQDFFVADKESQCPLDQPPNANYLKTIIKNSSLVQKSVRKWERRVKDAVKRFPENNRKKLKDALDELGTVYECTECGKRFARKSCLRVHLRIHSGEKVYKCKDCGRGFFQIGNLTRHMRIHSESKPYKCNLCEKSFTQSFSLTVHLRIHTGDKPYKCESCGKRFTQKGDLRQHSRIHTGEKPYKCGKCGKSFTHRPNLARHLGICKSKCESNSDYNGKSFLEEFFNFQKEYFPLQQETFKPLPEEKFEKKNCEEKESSKAVSSDGDDGEEPIIDEEYQREDPISKETIYYQSSCSDVNAISNLNFAVENNESKGNSFLQEYCNFQQGHFFCPKELSQNEQYRPSSPDFSILSEAVTNHFPSADDEENPEKSKKNGMAHECEECGKTFEYESCLTDHMLAHSGEKSHKCKVCGKAFRQVARLSRHLLSHSGEKSFQCDLCEKRFNRFSFLNYHLKIHKGEKPYKCEECGKAFVQEKELRKHSKVHSDFLPYKCEKCDRRFKYSFNFKRHVSICKGKRPSDDEEQKYEEVEFMNNQKSLGKTRFGTVYKCEECDKTFPRSSSLRVHLRIHSGEKRFKCKECGKGFRQTAHLKSHMQTHSAEKPWKCDLCEKRFTRKINLNLHWQNHFGLKPHECKECGKGFVQKGELNKHSKIHSGKAPYKCEMCEKRFNDRSNLKCHLRKCEGPTDKYEIINVNENDVAESERNLNQNYTEPIVNIKIDPDCQVPLFKSETSSAKAEENPKRLKKSSGMVYRCKECDKTFARKSCLRVHLQIHSGEKRHKCKECGKSFFQIGNLSRHVRTHSGETPFHCDLCEKSFTQRGSLVTHLRIHSGVKPFKCGECGKAFTRKGELNKHVKSRSDDKHYKCNELFRRKLNFKRHLQNCKGESS